ncbi:MAG TPA: hypothetical protein VMU17_03615, partial [Elusimicrobiota bacterium]|nr:hypothetical protein [Elusimicrobiota bacterium]
MNRARWLVWFLGVWLLLRMSGFLPLAPLHVAWSSQENYEGGVLPKYPWIRVDHASPSTEGLMIGVGEPGFAEWHFARPGPYPTTVQAYWLPADRRSRIVLSAGDGPRREIVLASGRIPLHFRAIDLTGWTAKSTAFAVRFEGENSILQALHWFEGQDPVPSCAALVCAILMMLLCLARTTDSLAIVALAVVALGLRWRFFRDYFSAP